VENAYEEKYLHEAT